MAKSFFAQILDMAGISLPDPNTQHHDPSKYRQTAAAAENTPARSSSGLTRVEQYLQKKNPPAKMTKVEQYLAKKQAAMAEAVTAEEPTPELDDSQLTGVERYLARKQAAGKTTKPQEKTTPAPSKPMTRVEKYLAQKKTAPAKPKAAASVKKAVKTPTTGVDKYLSRKKSAPAPVPAAKKEMMETAPPEEKQIVEVTESKKPATGKAVKKTEKTAPKTTQQEPVAEKTAAAMAGKPRSVIDHAEDADQCQAATQKGSRCRRKSNLEVLTKTIHKQKYRFAVCHQHNNSDFVPFEEFAPQS